MAVCQLHSRRTEGGFVLIATTIAITLLLAVAGLAIDLGRMYVIRAELQSFTDAAALTVAGQWDGSAAGQDRAKAVMKSLTEGPHAMRWDMGTRPITDPSLSFPAGPDGSHTVRVVASEPAPVIFLRIFQSRESSTVAAASVAVKDGTTARLTQ
ncbi:MAG TPA: pilus assembly protein TadG-related protein [Bryobacteraceae bacterium]|nr:pilus assembly protein TadG-related protein [Bryobacteraceae bacterium]